MMTANPHTAVFFLSLSWFVIYWILGGVVFALIAAANAMHMRKARFSCLFTIGAAAAALGAAYTGVVLSRPQGLRCPDELVSRGTLQGAEHFNIQSILVCDFRAVLIAGSLFFGLLLAAGMVAMLLSRTEKQR